MATGAPSPDGLKLRQKPQASARLNRKALFVVGGALAAILLFVLTNIASPPPAARKVETGKPPRILAAENAGQELMRDVPDVAPALPPPMLTEQPAAHASPEVPPLLSNQAAQPAQRAASDPELQQALRS